MVLIEPQVHGDERGFFLETYALGEWKALGVDADFVQQNHSRSSRGTLRGLHFQTAPGQAKLVRCAARRDPRRGRRPAPDSPTFGEWEGHVLDDENDHQLYVPIGFAHGFAVLSEVADVAYQVSSLYDPATEKGSPGTTPRSASTGRSREPLLSERDKTAPHPRRSPPSSLGEAPVLT